MDPLTNQEVIDFNNAKECFICNKEFTNDDKNVGITVIIQVNIGDLHIIHVI